MCTIYLIISIGLLICISTKAVLLEYANGIQENPEELGSYYEGDIVLPENRTWFYTRNGLIEQSSRWPRGIVPYEIKGKFSQQELSNIHNAFNEYHKNTCIRFKRRSFEKDYISIVNNKNGCWSSVGRVGGKQNINLQTPACLVHHGTAIHELMHVLGFYHEQNRYERDEYVKVIKENIKPGMLVNFQKASPQKVTGFGVSYDYASITHYAPTSFSKNGRPTIVALIDSSKAKQMGQRKGFSQGDILKIKAMYKCK